MDPAFLHLFAGENLKYIKLTGIADRCFNNSNERDVGTRFYVITERNINEKECHMELSCLILSIILSTRNIPLYTVVKTGSLS